MAPTTMSSFTAAATLGPGEGPAGSAAPALLPDVVHAVDVRSTRERADQLYRQYGAVVYRRCLRLLRDRDAAKDATQEVFIKLLREMHRLEDRPSALPWAFRVATNHCLNVLRDTRRRSDVPIEIHLEVRAEHRLSYPEAALAHAVLSRFDAQTQAVAVGVFVDGMEHEEVAEVLGISRRTVSRKLDRFLENARKFVARSDS